MDLFAPRAIPPCLGEEENWQCLGRVYFEKGKELLWLRSICQEEKLSQQTALIQGQLQPLLVKAEPRLLSGSNTVLRLFGDLKHPHTQAQLRFQPRQGEHLFPSSFKLPERSHDLAQANICKKKSQSKSPSLSHAA